MRRNDYTYISDDEKRRILELRAKGHSYHAIARIVARHYMSCQRVVSRHGANVYPKLSETKRTEIVRIYFTHPVTQRQLAQQFGVSQTTISQIITAEYKARKEPPA